MERRKFVLSVGTLAAGGTAAALGTGAFSSVEAERDVAVTVSEDASAYLGIQPGDGPNGEYADTTDSDALAINLTGDNDNVSGGGQGINANAVTGIEEVFQIQNQGTQDIALHVTPLAFGDVDFFDGILGVLLVPQAGLVGIDLEWPPWESNLFSLSALSPGEEIKFSLVAFALPETAVDSVEVSDELEITAEEL